MTARGSVPPRINARKEYVMKKHISYIDTLRVVASVFVVFMHTASGALRTDVAGHTGWFFLAGMSSVAFCAVPLFFMITGYLLTSSERTKDVKVLFRDRLPRLLVPLIFWSVLYVVQKNAAAHGSLADYLKSLASAVQKPANVSLWFMYALAAMYLISPLLCAGLRNLTKGGERLVVGIAIAVKLISVIRIIFPEFGAGYLDFDVVRYLEVFGGHLACFIIGWFLGKTEIRFPRPVLWAAALASAGAIFAGTVVCSCAEGAYVDRFQTQSGGFEILLAACLFLIAKQSRVSDASVVRRIARELAPCAFPIYLMHNFILIIFDSNAPVSLTGVLGKTGFVYLIALAVAWVCRFIPVLSYLVCGLPHRRIRLKQ